MVGDVGSETKTDISMNTWRLKEAKRKLSQVVDLAIERGPQLITRRGKKVAVVISHEEYMTAKKPQSKLSEFFRTSPLAKFDIDLNRDKGLPSEPGQ